jgi:hypothetical protein
VAEIKKDNYDQEGIGEHNWKALQSQGSGAVPFVDKQINAVVANPASL